MVRIEGQDRKEEDGGEDGAGLELQQRSHSQHQKYCREGVEEVIDIVGGEGEAGEAVGLLLVGDVEELVEEDGSDGEEEGGGGGAADQEGEEEEREEREERERIGLGLGVAALEQVVGQLIVEEQVRHRPVEHLLLERFYLAVACQLGLAHSI